MRFTSVQPGARRRLAVITATLLLGSLALSLASPAPPEEGPFPMPSDGFVIPAPDREAREGGWNLERLVEEFALATGEHLVWTQEAAGLLRAQTVGLDRELTVPPEDVYQVVETLLVYHRFVLIDLRREEPRMMGVASLETAARSGARSSARYVPREELAIWARHPAILVHTTVHLPHLDVRTLTNAMRGMVSDPNTSGALPILPSDNLVLYGFGPWVADQVELLERIDRAVAEEAPPDADEEEEGE